MNKSSPESSPAAELVSKLFSPSIRARLHGEVIRRQKRRRLIRRLLPPAVAVATITGGGILVATGEVGYKFFDPSKPAKSVPSEPDKFISKHNNGAQPKLSSSAGSLHSRHETSTGKHSKTVVRTIDKAAAPSSGVDRVPAQLPSSPAKVPAAGEHSPSSSTPKLSKADTGGAAPVDAGGTTYAPPVTGGIPATPSHVYQPGEAVIPNPNGNSTERNAYQLECDVNPQDPICKPS